MNPEIPTPREELEAKLTALLLGELPADEAFALGRAIEQDAELDRLYRRLKDTVGFVRETLADPAEKASVPTAPLKLSDQRREKLLSHVKTVRPRELAEPLRQRTSWFVPLAAAAIVLLLGVITLPNFIKARSTAQSNAIVNNLRQLDGAKQQWAIENQKTENDLPTMKDLEPYLKGRLSSIAGEKYVAGKVGEPVAADLSAAPSSKSFGTWSLTSSAGFDNGRRIRLAEDGQLASADKEVPARIVTGLPDARLEPAKRLITSLTSASTPDRQSGQSRQGGIVLPGAGNSYESQNTIATTPASPPGSPSGRPLTFLSSEHVVGGALDSGAQGGGGGGGGGGGAMGGGGGPVVAVTEPAPSRAIPASAPAPQPAVVAAAPGQMTFSPDGNAAFRRRYGLAPRSAKSENSPGNVELFKPAGKAPSLAQNVIVIGGRGGGGGGGGGAGGAVPNDEKRMADAVAASTPPPALQTPPAQEIDPRTGLPAIPESFRETLQGIDPTTGSPIFSGHDNRVDQSPGSHPAPNRLLRMPSQTTANSPRDVEVAAAPPRESAEFFRNSPSPVVEAKVEAVPILGDLPALGKALKGESELVQSEGQGFSLLGPSAKPEFEVKGSLRGFYDDDRQITSGTNMLAESELPRKDVGALAYLNYDAQKGKTWERRSGSTNLYSLDAVGYVNGSANGNAPAAKALREESATKTEKERAYLEARRDLEQKQRFAQMLNMKVAAEKIDVDLPKTTMVEIVDRATASEKEPGLLERARRALGGTVERTAKVNIDRDQSDISGMREAPHVASYDPYFVQTELEVIKSEAVLGKVIEDLNLTESWAKKNGDGKTLNTTEALELLKKKLDLRAVPNSSLLNIGVKSDNPEEAAKLANAVAKAYKDRRLEQRLAMSRGGITALEDRFKKQEQEIKLAQDKVNRLGEQLQIPNALGIADGPAMLMSQETLRKAEALRIESKAELARQEALLNRFKGKAPAEMVQALPTGVSDPHLSALIEQLNMIQENLANKQKNSTPESTDVAKLTSQAADLKEKINKRVDGIMFATEGRIKALKLNLQELDTELGNTNKKNGDEPSARKPAIDPGAPVPQPEVATSDNAFSTFSLNVSDVSFKLAAASLEKGQMPEPASIRSEEFINAFDYRDPEPVAGVPVGFAWERARYPFAHDRDLLRFSIKTAAAGRQTGRPLNIVLLLDNSGSMDRADRVQIIHEALRVLAGQLQPQDKLSVITFARTARLFVDGVAGDQAGRVAEEVSGLTPQGGTNLEEAMNLAYQTAARHYLPNGINRVVLLTDGAANLGDVTPESLKQRVETQRKQGIALDCFGIGWEGLNDDLLEILSRNGDGRYGFINTPDEAATEFAGQLAGALHVAASDVKVQIEFNPQRVTAYRQIGYAKHQLAKEQFRDNTVDAAEIGAAEAGNALYVIESNPAGQGPLAVVRVRFKVPGTSDYREHEWQVPYTGNAVALEQASPAMRLAATASAFSEWLVASPYASEVTPDRLLGYLSGVPEVYGADGQARKLEWMIRQAKSVTGK